MYIYIYIYMCVYIYIYIYIYILPEHSVAFFDGTHVSAASCFSFCYFTHNSNEQTTLLSIILLIVLLLLLLLLLLLILTLSIIIVITLLITITITITIMMLQLIMMIITMKLWARGHVSAAWSPRRRPNAKLFQFIRAMYGTPEAFSFCTFLSFSRRYQ